MKTDGNNSRWSPWTIVCLALLGLSVAGVALTVLFSPLLELYGFHVFAFFASPFVVITGIVGLISALLGRSRRLSGLLAVLGIVLALSLLSFLAAKFVMPAYHKAQTSAWRGACINNLRMIDAAKDNCALKYCATNGTPFTWDNIGLFIKDMTNRCYCPAAKGTNRHFSACYRMNPLGIDPECMICPDHTLARYGTNLPTQAIRRDERQK